MAGLASHKSASGLGLRTRPLVLCHIAPNSGDAADIVCSSINIFSVVLYIMCSKNLTVQNWQMHWRRRWHASCHAVPWVLLYDLLRPLQFIRLILIMWFYILQYVVRVKTAISSWQIGRTIQPKCSKTHQLWHLQFKIFPGTIPQTLVRIVNDKRYMKGRAP